MKDLWLKARALFAKLPLAWQAWVEGLVVAVGWGVCDDVVVPMLKDVLAHKPVSFHGLTASAWASAVLVGGAWLKTHRPPPWDGQERRQP